MKTNKKTAIDAIKEGLHLGMATWSPEKLKTPDAREFIAGRILQALEMRSMIAVAETEQSDTLCEESDGCPTEKAVLQRFWREHQASAFEALKNGVLRTIKPSSLTNEEIFARNAHVIAMALADYGYAVRKRVGEIRVTAKDMSDAMLLAEASALGYDVVYDTQPGSQHTLTPEGERIVRAVAEGDFSKVTDRQFQAYQTFFGKDPSADATAGEEVKPKWDRDILIDLAFAAKSATDDELRQLVWAAEKDLLTARRVSDARVNPRFDTSPVREISLAIDEDVQINMDVPAGVDQITLAFDCQKDGHHGVVLGHAKDSMHVLSQVVLRPAKRGWEPKFKPEFI